MKRNIDLIIKAIDDYLVLSKIEFIDPVNGGVLLEKKGLLKDSKDRPGLPLRNLLRKGLIPHAYQVSGRGSSWIIPLSTKGASNYIFKKVQKNNIKKGKTEFTSQEISEIKNLILVKTSASSKEQKLVRHRIRNIGFYFSSFYNGKTKYDLDNFNKLIANGSIRQI